ncbi:MAG: MFS transporter [Hyphomicrobiales bacterium]
MSPEHRATIYAFTQFLSVGAATVYGGIWFTSKGLTPDQIGIINSAPVFVLLLLSIFLGRVADRANDWRSVIVAGSLGAALFSCGLFVSPSFLPILVFWSLANIAYGGIGPVIDAAFTRFTERRGTSYGALRAWATIGYVVAVFATGPVMTAFGGGLFVALYVGLSVLRAVAALGLPRFRGESAAAAEGGATHLFHMLKPWLFLPLLAWAMIHSTNVSMMAFQAIYMKEHGVSENVIGYLIAAGAVGEAAVLYAFPWFKRHFAPQSLILIAGLTAVVRWACFAQGPDMPWLVPLQLLNAITYGVGFLGVMAFITKWTAEDMAAEAQSFLGVVQQVMVILMVTGFGYLYTAFGAQAFFASMAMALVAVIVLLATGRLAPAPAAAARG